MIEFQIDDIDDTKIIFETLSKRNVCDVLQYHCHSLFQCHEDDLQIIDGKLCLPIHLESMFKNEDEPFLCLLEVLKKITDPKTPNFSLILDAKITGFDKYRQLHFVFEDEFVGGRHCIVGKEGGTSFIYDKKLYIR